MKFVNSTEMKINLTKEQEGHLCSKEYIKKIAKKRNIISYDIYDNDTIIGFAQLRKYKRNCYFLWNFAIDIEYQNKHFGISALKELLVLLKKEYKVKEVVTTYTFGNEHAKHVYETVGFVETDVVDEDGVHEVNMVYKYE